MFLFLCLVVVAMIVLPAPFLIKSLIDSTLPNRDALQLKFIVAGLVLVELASNFFNIVNSYVMNHFSQKLSSAMRRHIFRHFLDLPLQNYLETPSGQMTNRMVTDTEEVAQFVHTSLHAIPLPLMTLGIGGGLLAFWHWPMALFIFATIPLTLMITRSLSNRLRILRQDQRQHQEEFQGQITEGVDNIRVIRAFAREKAFDKELGEHIDRYSRQNMDLLFTTSCLRSSSRVVELFSEYIFIIFGAWLVIGQEITLGSFFAFRAFQSILAGQLDTLFNYFSSIPAHLVSIERALSIMDMPVEAGLHQKQACPPLKGQIDFKQVSLRYPDGTLALEHIDLSIRAGEIVAIVGPSGSGKTSLSSLLLGLYLPEKGRIEVDGMNIHDLELNSYRRQIAMIFQEAELFNRSIRDNLLIANPSASDADMWRALQLANASEFVSATPKQLEAIIGSRGILLSGGQRQRLSIARAILKNPAILIMDEATSALDSISEKAIRGALDDIARNRTTLIIAHRLSTVAHASRVIVMERGHIVETGTHRELLAAGGLYSSLHASQMNGFLQTHPEPAPSK